ncbi:hypothetical protein GCM10009528_41800 [Kineococcus aurantiacus]
MPTPRHPDPSESVAGTLVAPLLSALGLAVVTYLAITNYSGRLFTGGAWSHSVTSRSPGRIAALQVPHDGTDHFTHRFDVHAPVQQHPVEDGTAQ